MEKNTEQLQKIASFFNTDRLLTKDDTDTVLKGLIKILATNKKSYEDATKGHQENNQQLFQQIVDVLHNHTQTVETQTKTHLDNHLQQTQGIIEQIKNAVPKDGEPGQDGISPDVNEIVDTVLQKIQLPEQKELMLDPEDLVNKLSSLQGKKRLSIKAIEGLDKFLETWGNAIRNDVTYKSVGRVIGGGNFKAGANITIASDGTISSSGGGGGFTKLVATGTVDGSNAAFTFTSKPTYIISDGAWYVENSGWTWNSGSLTATLSVPPQTGIFGFV